ncbi:2,3,4,5-tetrahydropyridine-2,6-dicarboxylate N-succinyltransferase, partial [bacterium]|nr:2,3,4,5-tetrahydropyridine-2,6-dicarboxylate N-succinyltransferase [bacterium]
MPSSFFLSSEEILSLPEKEKQAFFNAFFSKLESGELRSCYFDGTQWVYDAWIRTTILSYFKTHSSMSMEGYPHSFDKIPLQNTSSLVRRIPGSLVRRGAYIGQNSILMPSFVNIGAYIGEGTMLDTWSTVGSCAYIGKRCH